MKKPDPWANVRPLYRASSRARAFSPDNPHPHPIDEIKVWRWVARLIFWPAVVIGLLFLWALLPQ